MADFKMGFNTTKQINNKVLFSYLDTEARC